jgi:hypothetical protein
MCPLFRHFLNRPSWFSVNKSTPYKHWASDSPLLSFPRPSASADPEETHKSLDGEIGGFT